MARSEVKVKNQDAVADAEPAQKCGSDHACAAREGPQLRRRRAMLTGVSPRSADRFRVREMLSIVYDFGSSL